MTDKLLTPAKGPFTAVVRENKCIGPSLYRMLLEFSPPAAEVMSRFRPGQFVQIDLGSAALPVGEKIPPELANSAHRGLLLRRPFSFTDVVYEREKTLATLLYCVVGPASLRMTTLPAGGLMSVIGPLGNGYWVPEGKKKAFLVFGGTGTAPVQHLAKTLVTNFKEREIEIIAFAGAKSARELPFEGHIDEISAQVGFSIPAFSKYCIESLIATDDGSTGFRGTVTDCFLQWLEQNHPSPAKSIIYSCGPSAMLARIVQIARDKTIDCQISMEERMACGFGVCQGCPVECRVEGSNETVYKLCCEDGPVFDSKEVVF